LVVLSGSEVETIEAVAIVVVVMGIWEYG
jgi:hypothetical protein